MNETSLILEARNIHRNFETKNSPLEVLKGVNLNIQQGDIVAITGASGVGKSTLLHILGGLDRPTSGEIMIDRQNLKDKSEHQLARFRNDKIGFVFQFHYLLEDFTALENVMVPLLVQGKKRKESILNAEQMLESVGLIDRKDHKSNQLSGGEQQRVAVARALANNPKLVIADEPSGNLDITTGRKLHDLILKLNDEKNITFLIATHNQELSSTCKKHYKLVEGIVTDYK